VSVEPFSWDVYVPGEDLPHSLTTDYLVSEGEQISVDGRAWLVEHVELDEPTEVVTGRISVVAPAGSAGVA
jgi:hypothetical protein